MEANVSKAQAEVWEWKEKASQDIQDLPSSEQIKYIREQTDAMIKTITKKESV